MNLRVVFTAIPLFAFPCLSGAVDTIIVVTDRGTAKPVSGAEVTILTSDRRGTTIREGTTDKNGEYPAGELPRKYSTLNVFAVLRGTNKYDTTTITYRKGTWPSKVELRLHSPDELRYSLSRPMPTAAATYVLQRRWQLRTDHYGRRYWQPVYVWVRVYRPSIRSGLPPSICRPLAPSPTYYPLAPCR